MAEQSEAIYYKDNSDDTVVADRNSRESDKTWQEAMAFACNDIGEAKALP